MDDKELGKMSYPGLQEMIRTKESLIILLQEKFDRGEGDCESLMRELQEIIHLKEFTMNVLNEFETIMDSDYEKLNQKFKEIERLLDKNPPPDVRNALLAGLLKVLDNQSRITQELQKVLVEYKLALMGHKHYSDLLEKYESE